MMRYFLLAFVISLTYAVKYDKERQELRTKFVPVHANYGSRDDVCIPPPGKAFWIFICNQESWAYSGFTGTADPAYFCVNSSDPTETRIWLHFMASNHATQGTQVACTDPQLRAQITLIARGSWANPQALADNLLLTLNQQGWVYVVVFGEVPDCDGAHCVNDDNCCVVTATTANGIHASVYAYKVM